VEGAVGLLPFFLFFFVGEGPPLPSLSLSEPLSAVVAFLLPCVAYRQYTPCCTDNKAVVPCIHPRRPTVT